MPARKSAFSSPPGSPGDPPSSTCPQIPRPRNTAVDTRTPAALSAGTPRPRKPCTPSKMSTECARSGSALCAPADQSSDHSQSARETRHTDRPPHTSTRTAECRRVIPAQPALGTRPRPLILSPCASSRRRSCLYFVGTLHDLLNVRPRLRPPGSAGPASEICHLSEKTALLLR